MSGGCTRSERQHSGHLQKIHALRNLYRRNIVEENKTLVDELEDLQIRLEALAAVTTRIATELLELQKKVYQNYERKGIQH